MSYQAWPESEATVSVNCDLSFVVNLGPQAHPAGQLMQPMLRRVKKRIQGDRKLRQCLVHLGNKFK